MAAGYAEKENLCILSMHTGLFKVGMRGSANLLLNMSEENDMRGNERRY